MPVPRQPAFGLRPVAREAEIEARRRCDREGLAERLPHRVPGHRARRIGHLQRTHQMVRVHEVSHRRRGVDGVDHRDRHVAKPDIFARRHACRGRLGDDMAVHVVETVGRHSRRDVRRRAFGQLRRSVVDVRCDREGSGLGLNKMPRGVISRGRGRLTRDLFGAVADALHAAITLISNIEFAILQYLSSHHRLDCRTAPPCPTE